MADQWQSNQGTPLGAIEVEDVVPVLPAGIYGARLGAVESRNNDQGEYWHWTFIAQNGDEDVEISATTSPRITPRTKAAKWLMGLGVDVSVGARVNFMELLDTPCQIVVIIGDTGYSRIDAVLPPAK